MDEKIKSLIEENWEKILYSIQLDHGLSATTINTFIRPLEVYNASENTIYLLRPQDTLGQRGVDFLINKSYDLFIRTSIQSVLNRDFDIKILASPEDYTNLNSAQADGTLAKEYSMEECNLNPRYTFDTFVVGDNNRHAHAACVAVAEDPGRSMNPLFLYSGAGLGKTHLMHSIGHYVLQHNKNAKVLYVPSESFTNELIECIKKNKPEDFREKYRNIDLLLLDDIQFIIGKEATQNEFFNTFNVLHEAGKQIVISSDKPPKELAILDDRIKSRLEWGLPIDIQPPDFETRSAILRERVAQDNIDISEEVIEYIATNFESNIRELEGALNKIKLFSKLDNKPITVEFAESTLLDMISKNSKKEITIPLIIETVGEHLDVPVDDILSTKRSADIALARQISMYLSRALTGKSYDTIGDYFKKDHSTVMHAFNKIKDDCKTDSSLAAKVETIHKKLSPS